MNRSFTFTLWLIGLATVASAQSGLHPEIDAFRSGNKAYVIGPPRPVAAFDYIDMIQPSFDGAEWLLVQHRARRTQDGAARITEADFMRPTETSLYHPARNMVRSLPAAIPAGQRFLQSGLGDVVVLAVTTQDASSPGLQRYFAIDAPTGRVMELPDTNQVWVVDSQWFLTQQEGRIWLLNWAGDRRSIPLDQKPEMIQPTGVPGKFVVGTHGAPRNLNWHLLDVNAGRIEPTTPEVVSEALERGWTPPGLMILPEADRPDSHVAWFANPKGKDFLNLSSPTWVWGLPDGRLPHELDSRAVIAGDLTPLPYFVPAGYAPGVGGKLGAAWYVRDHMMFVRAVEEMSMADYTKYIAMLAQDRAMAMAQDAVLAFNSYRAQNEERLPENAGWRASMRPYIRDGELFGRVTYLGNGERMTEFREYQQVLGFIDTPYGRANFNYGNGVTWVPKVTP